MCRSTAHNYSFQCGWLKPAPKLLTSGNSSLFSTAVLRYSLLLHGDQACDISSIKLSVGSVVSYFPSQNCKSVLVNPNIYKLFLREWYNQETSLALWYIAVHVLLFIIPSNIFQNLIKYKECALSYTQIEPKE